jgi:hypothetical protein
MAQQFVAYRAFVFDRRSPIIVPQTGQHVKVSRQTGMFILDLLPLIIWH